MSQKKESFSSWVTRRQLTESDIIWALDYLFEKRVIPTVEPVNLDRLVKLGTEVENTNHGKEALRQLKAAYRTRGSRSKGNKQNIENSKTAALQPAIPQKNKNYTNLIRLAEEILRSEEDLKEKTKALDLQKKELKEKLSKTIKTTKIALKKSKDVEKLLNFSREDIPKNLNIKKITSNISDIKEILIATLNHLDPPSPRERPIREADISRHRNRPKPQLRKENIKRTKTEQLEHTPNTLEKIFNLAKIQYEEFTGPIDI